MKKISSILIGVLLISVTLAGCGSEAVSNTVSASGKAPDKVQQVSSKTTGQNSEVSQTENKSDKTNALSFEIVSKTYINKNVKINYPQIVNFSDADKQNQVNDLIKNDILNDYQKDVSKLVGYAFDNYKDAEAGLTENVNYYIKLNNSRLLSVLYVKNSSIPNSAHPGNSVHSINIYIENGTILKFKDLINIDNNFAEKLKNIKDKMWTIKLLPGISADNADKNLAGVISDNLSMLSNKDIIDEFSSDDYSFYFTKDYFGMSIDVPHAAGDYAELEIKYNDIKDNIRPENEVWKSFINQ